jgi:hypothetical protein
MTQGWGQGDKAANEYFQPIETYGWDRRPRFSRKRELAREAPPMARCASSKTYCVARIASL